MANLSIESTGSFKNLETYLDRVKKDAVFKNLSKYGAQGVAALSAATPVDSSLTRDSWEYKIVKKKGFYSIVWNNTNVVDGVQIAVILQYGHATRTGGWVEGRDYINPVIRPLFDKIATDVWNEVIRNG